ncbi:protein mbtH [Caballeronia jiangsuensis]|nr:protein mbtH [Caballeronia jiangsuensis]
MDNPFDDDEGTFCVLINESRQRSLWPAHLDVPAGWEVEHTISSRKQCLDYIDAHWTDPRSDRTPI